MANTTEYNLKLNDFMSSELREIALAAQQSYKTLSRTYQQIDLANGIITTCTENMNEMQQSMSGMARQQQLISNSSLDAVQRTSQEVEELREKIEQTNNIQPTGIRRWTGVLTELVPSLKTLTNPLALASAGIGKLTAYVKGSTEAWNKQLEAEQGVARSMKASMGASDAEVASIVGLAKAQQKLGVISDEVQLAGAQELATNLKKSDSLKQLLPAMNDMVAQQYGVNATQEQAAAAAKMMQQAMNGQTDVLTRCGYRFTEAQEQMLKYGNEEQRAATLAAVVGNAVGGMNQALAQTPEGQLKQSANSMEAIHERVGKLYTAIQAALLPVFNVLGNVLNDVVTFFENNKETIVAGVNVIAEVIGGVCSVLWSVVSGIISVFGWWWQKLQDGSVIITVLTIAVGALAGAMLLLLGWTQLLAFWAGVVSTAKKVWAGVQWVLNSSMLACPLTWIIGLILALVGTIVWLCTKVTGWGSLWNGIMGAMKYGFLAYVESIKLAWTGFINGFMIGINKIMLGWYKFKNAVGLGDEAENNAAIAGINADTQARQQAIIDGAKKVTENANKARESLAGISMGIKGKNTPAEEGTPASGGGISALSLPGAENSGVVPINQTTSPGAAQATSQSAVTGGTRSSNVVVNLGKLMDNVNIYAQEFRDGLNDLDNQVLDSLTRVLTIAQSSVR